MLSIFDQGSPPPCPDAFNLAAHVLGCAPRFGSKVALSVLGKNTARDWTYDELIRSVRGTGTGLLRAGLVPGDIVLMRLGNTVDFPIAYLGAIAAGLIPVPTSSQLTTSETSHIISELSPAAVLLDPTVSCGNHPKTIDIYSLREMRNLPPCDWSVGDPDRLAYIVYTSGTSGKQRAVAHAHRAIWARQMMMTDWYDLKPQDRLCHAGAFNWTFTLGTGLMDPWTMGATALIPEPGTPFSEFPDLLRRHQATIFAAAPGVYRKLLSLDTNLEIPSLRHGLCAGEKLSPHLQALWAEKTKTGLYEAYGLSECSTFISANPENPARTGTFGRPQVGRRVAIVNENGPVRFGEEGIIAVHRDDPGLMIGYLNAPEEAAAKMQGEWFLTGDLGSMADDGQITYLGRNDDMMNAGGFRVSPIEVESVLAAHSEITQVGVTAVEVKPGTRVIAAFYTGPSQLDEHSLQTYVQDKLARYKQPRAYIYLSELPTGANGKLLRRDLPNFFQAGPQE